MSKYFVANWRSATLAAENIAAAKAEFLSVMSHEIRTPLNALIGTTYHLLDENPRDDQKTDFYNLKNASENLLHLVNNILDFNKIEQGKLELEMTEVRLENYLRDLMKVFESMAEKKNIRLNFYYDQELPEFVKLDKGRVAQILNNLISNAIKFTESGDVTLDVLRGDNQDEGVSVWFTVKDTGVGIRPADQERIFETFEQVQMHMPDGGSGTGLGLAITQNLLHHMGSVISLKSEYGRGSAFSFCLNLEPVTIIAPVEKNVKDYDLSAYSVLLVEDNAMNVMIAKRLLTKWNLTVDVASNGHEGVEKVKENHYDLILMDIQMPVMDGGEATRQIRDMGFKLPIIALTASAISDQDLKVKYTGMDDYITKPYNPEELFEKVKFYIQQKLN